MDTANMTNQEIDRAVAKLMGWKESESGLLWTPTYHTIADWSPSTNIAHAWEVAMKVSSMASDVHFTLLKFTTNYLAAFRTPRSCDCNGSDKEAFFNEFVSAHTAPLAICRAALKAMEADK